MTTGAGDILAQFVVPVGYSSFVTIPASGSPLASPIKAILITTAGNLGVVMPDGTSNNTQLVAVVAGQLLALAAVSFSAANTAVAIGLR